MWWLTPIIPTLSSLRQEDHEFKASLGHIARSYLKKMGYGKFYKAE
jgi:hypothetical protein